MFRRDLGKHHQTVKLARKPPAFFISLKRFHSALKDARDAIAHYLIERDDVESHVYLADGTQFQFYSSGASGVLPAHLAVAGIWVTQA